ncbi:unnamed protein product [Brassica rapa]|uniref:PRP1 splicing factor N-terminal domain-containing protein n=1 Tax=Brassica campestris TaxID=3711 RepID=A0A8D9FYC6_BRACM|nr:unnamed protein product [Brassica rapa]
MFNIITNGMEIIWRTTLSALMLFFFLRYFDNPPSDIWNDDEDYSHWNEDDGDDGIENHDDDDHEQGDDDDDTLTNRIEDYIASVYNGWRAEKLFV